MFVNTSTALITVQLTTPMHEIIPKGGGAVGVDGAVTPPPSLAREMVSSVVVAAKSASILLHTSDSV